VEPTYQPSIDVLELHISNELNVSRWKRNAVASPEKERRGKEEQAAASRVQQHSIELEHGFPFASDPRGRARLRSRHQHPLPSAPRRRHAHAQSQPPFHRCLRFAAGGPLHPRPHLTAKAAHQRGSDGGQRRRFEGRIPGMPGCLQ
jgi:hypothetical protein